MATATKSYWWGSVGALFIALALYGWYWNEFTRINLFELALNAKPVDSGAPLIYYSDRVESNESFGGDEYIIPFANSVYVERTTQMYGWREHEERDDGSTTYSYKKEWLSTLQNWQHFRYKKGHENPTPAVKVGVKPFYQTVRLGRFYLQKELRYPKLYNVELNSYMLKALYPMLRYTLYFSERKEEHKEIGDIRIYYHYYPASTYSTLFGVQDGQTIRPYLLSGSDSVGADRGLYRLFGGGVEEALGILEHEEFEILWFGRFFAMMFIVAGVVIVLFATPLYGRIKAYRASKN